MKTLLTAWLLLAVPGLAQEVLRQAAEVRALPADQALNGLPVQLRGVVGFIDAPGTVFLQDASGGTFFRAKPNANGLKVGDVVEVAGVTSPGLYLTGVEAQTFTVVGQGEPPAAAPASYDDLRSGRYHYQRVRVQGIGRRLSAPEENRALLHLAVGDQVLEVRIDAPPPADLEAWVDAELIITGLAAGGINDRRQLVFPYLRVADWSEVKVRVPAPPPAAIKTLSAARLLRFDPAQGQTGGHRVRVSGRVLAAFDDGRLFVRDLVSEPIPGSQRPSETVPPPAPRTAPLAIRLVKAEPLQPGQRVEVIGFPDMQGFSASLVDARLHGEVAPEREPVEPVAATMKDLLDGALDAELVQMKAELLDVFRTAQGVELRLIADGVPLRAELATTEPLQDLRPGASLRLTGISLVESSTDSGFRSRPQRAMLLLRQPSDLEVLKAPSLWTVRRLVGVIAVLGGLVVMALLWITLLRRQVAKQAGALRVRVAREAVLEERQRIAREFHDTLEQELAGLSLRLDAASTRPLESKAQGLLETSRHLVSRIQTEARNLVADLRAAPDEAADLAGALRDLVAQLPAEAGLTAGLHLDGTVPPLPAHVVHHLRMIAQEAVTNVLKHARARQLSLALRVGEGALHLVVEDDGRGLGAASTEGQPGHFGCMGIRERCQRIGARVAWSAPAAGGTRVEIQLPLPA